MSRAGELSYGTSWLFATNNSRFLPKPATKDWLKVKANSRRLLIVVSLITAYAAFGTIVRAAYLALETSPHRAASIAPEPLAPQTLALEDAWRQWLRHQSDLEDRIDVMTIDVMTRARSSWPDEILPADSSDPSSLPPTPSFKPVEAATAIASALPALAATAPTPFLKPAAPLQEAPYPSALERTRGEGDRTSSPSDFATLFEPASADAITASAGSRPDDGRTSAGDIGLADGENLAQRSDADTASRDEAVTGGARGDTRDRRADDRSASRSAGAERDRSAHDDRSSARSDAGQGTAPDRTASRDRGPNDGRSSARSDGDRGRGNDRGFGGDRGPGNDRGLGNDRSRGERGARGGRGGRGDRGDRGDRGGRGRGGR